MNPEQDGKGPLEAIMAVGMLILILPIANYLLVSEPGRALMANVARAIGIK